MSPADEAGACVERDMLEEHALTSLSTESRSRLELHLALCEACRKESESLQAAVRPLAGWPGEELRPASSLWGQVVQRIGNEGWSTAEQEQSLPSQWPDIEWEEPAPGVHCKVLSSDAERHRVSLIVRLDPGVEYPPHTHAGVEELHLLDGELWIDDLKLYPGEFHRAEPGTSDSRVWSETGCSCVLITSANDQLR